MVIFTSLCRNAVVILCIMLVTPAVAAGINGISPKEAANSVVTVSTVKNCPKVFAIKKEHRARLKAVKTALGKEFLHLKRSRESLADCLRRAKEYCSGPKTLVFLGLTSWAKNKLKVSCG